MEGWLFYGSASGFVGTGGGVFEDIARHTKGEKPVPYVGDNYLLFVRGYKVSRLDIIIPFLNIQSRPELEYNYRKVKEAETSENKPFLRPCCVWIVKEVCNR